MPIRERIKNAFGDSLQPNDKYLSYYDVNLTGEDIKTLRNNDWMTDNLISFWEEYLERETLPKYPQARISLIRPSMTMILLKDKNLDMVRKQLPDFQGITHIFLPITDAPGFTAEGGTHWSLLLVSTLDGVAFHYDSLASGNITEAKQATQRLSHVLGRELRFHNIDDCPQQSNSFDCGVYVCILMRHLLVKRLLHANYREKVSMSMTGKNLDAPSARKEMIKIIEGLKREGERRRSVSPFSSKSDTPRIS